MRQKNEISPYVELDGVWYPVGENCEEVGIGGIVTRRFLPENSRIVIEARNGKFLLQQKYVVTDILPDTVEDDGKIIRHRVVDIFPRI